MNHVTGHRLIRIRIAFISSAAITLLAFGWIAGRATRDANERSIEPFSGPVLPIISSPHTIKAPTPSSETKSPQKTGARSIPYAGDETSLIAIQADPLKYISKPVILCGAVWIQPTGDAPYGFGANEYAQVVLREVSSDNLIIWERRMRLYVPKQSLADVLGELTSYAEEQDRHGGDGCRLARVKGVLLPRTGSCFDEMSVIDIQLGNGHRTGWRPWSAKSAPQPSRQTSSGWIGPRGL
jgi:hypothetical protein